MSSLVPVKRLPKTLSFARTRRNSYGRVKEEVEGYTPPFCINERFLYTLSDLNNEQNVLRDFCDVDSIDKMSVSVWLENDVMRNNLVFLMNQLFGSHCYRCGLAYSPDFRRTYFPRENDKDEDTKFERKWTSPRTNRSDRRTVVQRYEYGTFTFWRHLAAEFSFVEIGGKWYLQITPKYLFTVNGKTPSNPKLVGRYLRG